MELKDRQVTVIGLGITGYYMALLARSLGARVTVTDIKQAGAFEQLIINELREKGIRLELGGHDENTLLNSDLVIPSPGVPLDIAPLRLAYSSGIPVVGELDILTELSNVPVIAVTGTNGKSTVTTFIGQLLKKAKKRVFVGGNLGTPPAKVLLDGKKIDFFVLEVSSFQLDLTKKFRPYIGILLNITADHLDRYESFEAYAASKLSIFKNQTDDDFAIVNLDDEIIQNSLIDTKAKVLGYTIKGNPRACVRVEMDRVLFRTPLVDNVVSIKQYKLYGDHNISNLVPVLMTGAILSIDPVLMEATVSSFRGLPHRMELVREFEDRLFIDDSKATNVDAAVKAILSFSRPIVLIMGGRHKGADYKPIVEAGKGKIRCAVLVGEAKDLIAEDLEGKINYVKVKDLEHAVKVAYMISSSGDVILLSPACSSFDMFKDYKHRGEVFKKAVKALK